MPYYKASSIIKQSLPFFLFLLVLSLTTGNVLNTFVDDVLYKYIFLLVVLPGFISAIGDTGSVFVSRLTSHIFIGELDSSFRPFRILFSNIIGLLLTTLTHLLAISGIAYIVSLIFAIGVDFVVIVAIFLLSGFSSVLILMFFGIITTYLTYKYGLNPDNFTSPLMGNLGDLVGSATLILFALLLI